jgi:hypothetical protein
MTTIILKEAKTLSQTRIGAESHKETSGFRDVSSLSLVFSINTTL